MKKARTGVGKSFREGINWMQLLKKFPDDSTAEKWFAKHRWKGTPKCPHCGSVNIQCDAKHASMPYRCRTCRKRFSVRIGTAMEDTKLGYQVWAMAIYILTTGIKGVSSMKLHRDLGVTQKTAWFLAHRIRESWEKHQNLYLGPVEVDETYMGGKEKNKHEYKKLKEGRGAVGKTAVVGAKDRATNKVEAKVISDTTSKTLTNFVGDTTKQGSKVFTDDATAYSKLEGYEHKAVKHSVKEFVNGMAHTNGIESFWALLKRGYHGTYHHMSSWQLQRYVNEFEGRFNDRNLDTIDQMNRCVEGMVGKRLTYKRLKNSKYVNS